MHWTKRSPATLRLRLVLSPALFLLLASRGPSVAIGATENAPAPCSSGHESAHHSTAPAEAIPWSEIGTRAGAQYQGDGLSVRPTANGAVLRCVFQKLAAEATPEGLWLTSTVSDSVSDRFRVVATQVGRVTPCAPSCFFGANSSPEEFGAHGVTRPTRPLPATGTVQLSGDQVRFLRPGLVEEYSVSMDGVRQDFVVELPPEQEHRLGVGFARGGQPKPVTDRRSGQSGELRIELAVTGARVEETLHGARLVLENSGRKIAYSRLRVTDATGRELPARMEVASEGARHLCRLDVEESAWAGNFLDTLEDPALKRAEARAPVLAILVNDADAVSPVRIDPTFSDENWISMGGIPGANNTVFAAIVDDSGNLYVGGNFTLIGDVIANRIAKWDGSGWSALGSGMDDQVEALAMSANDLYAGGMFTTADGVAANYVAKWNGNSWSALGPGMNGWVRALALSGGDLYAGGEFTTAGSVSANNIAKWDGASWSALGSGVNGNVAALVVSGGDLYAGGRFTTAGGVMASYIAKWDGGSWSALGSGVNWFVHALAVSGSDLYAGGLFTTAGGVTANRIAKWDQSSWSALGSGMDDTVRALAVSGSDLYVGGLFTTVGVVAANYIAKWSGSSWSALGSGMNSGVYTLAVSGSDLYAGGSFRTAGGVKANGIAKWGGTNWSALGSGMSGLYSSNVNALAVSGSDLFAGGDFTRAGGVTANYIAKWNGSSWSALGSGMNWIVHALAISGNDLYAGGNFTTAGGVSAHNIATWDGSSWSALGSGMNSTVRTLAVSGSDLYAGGNFTAAGGVMAHNIAKWDGNNWSDLGSEMNGIVRALAVWGSDLYAGGEFTTAGGVTVNRIAKWDGSSWSALGSGIGGSLPYVSALAVLGGDLYTGGFFTTAGEKVSAYIAKAQIVLPANVVAPPFLDGTDFVARFAGTPGVAYTIEYTDEVSPTHWQKKTNLTAPDTDQGLGVGVFEFREPILPAGQRFYRAVYPAY